jgi:hypothetical protein
MSFFYWRQILPRRVGCVPYSYITIAVTCLFIAHQPVYSGHDHGQNQDLNDLILVETPAVLQALKVDRYTRLQALGFDAISMIDHWRQAEATQATLFQGRTGLLKRLANGEIERELNSVAFDGGKLKALPVR